MTGRKPKPTALKLLTGNPGKRALNRDEPTPDTPLGAPPAHLSAPALAEWDRIAAGLVGSRIATDLDAGIVAAYCQAYGRWSDAEEALAQVSNGAKGLVIKTKSGNLIQNPLVGIANKAMADMARYAAELGLTPSARSRVTCAPPPAKDNPFALLEAMYR